MIALEVYVNGRRVCLAGAEDLAVLSTIITASGQLGKKTVPPRSDALSVNVHYSVGGLTSRADPDKDVHKKWKSIESLRVGDVIEVRVVETQKADRPKSLTSNKSIRKLIDQRKTNERRTKHAEG